ncbi:MAG: tetratricopeptide repeat protein [Akkermansiaceae bacterium]|jgi:tetratricopeptide (TPR) repeat protein|nr:tetratricopeptide repeat protein [Akkermansiaceae bacterium]
MKLPLLLALLISSLLPVLAQENPPQEKALAEWEQNFLNLPETRRTEFLRAIDKARELFGQKRIFETIDELHKARAIFVDSPDLENLLGACQVEFRAFDKAMDHFKRADTLAPESPNILFNVAEVYFVTKEWDKAEQMFSRILALLGDDKAQLPMARIVEFKRLLCLIKLERIDEARELAVKYDLFDDSPFPYYAEAAMAFHDGREVDAELAIARGNRIFADAAVIAPWQDTLMEFGYIKSFYGGDISEE